MLEGKQTDMMRMFSLQFNHNFFLRLKSCKIVFPEQVNGEAGGRRPWLRVFGALNLHRAADGETRSTGSGDWDPVQVLTP